MRLIVEINSGLRYGFTNIYIPLILEDISYSVDDFLLFPCLSVLGLLLAYSTEYAAEDILAVGLERHRHKGYAIKLRPEVLVHQVGKSGLA
jgi:hypothetical protein